MVKSRTTSYIIIFIKTIANLQYIIFLDVIMSILLYIRLFKYLVFPANSSLKSCIIHIREFFTKCKWELKSTLFVKIGQMYAVAFLITLILLWTKRKLNAGGQKPNIRFLFFFKIQKKKQQFIFIQRKYKVTNDKRENFGYFARLPILVESILLPFRSKIIQKYINMNFTMEALLNIFKNVTTGLKRSRTMNGEIGTVADYI